MDHHIEIHPSFTIRQIALSIELHRKCTKHQNLRTDSRSPIRDFQKEAEAAALASTPCGAPRNPHYETARRAPSLPHHTRVRQGDMAWDHRGGATTLPRHIATT
jgi:hypothetical protein